jgi:hypothetical protein
VTPPVITAGNEWENEVSRLGRPFVLVATGAGTSSSGVTRLFASRLQLTREPENPKSAWHLGTSLARADRSIDPIVLPWMVARSGLGCRPLWGSV